MPRKYVKVLVSRAIVNLQVKCKAGPTVPFEHLI